MTILGRHLAQRVERALKTSRVVNVVGPRQAGKSTLVRDLIRHGRYLTLDDDAIRAALEADPHSQFAALRGGVAPGLPVVLDEIQRLPGVTLALKRIIDADPAPGQFLLTGSADIFTYGRAVDSLAGRVQTLTLRPLGVAEILQAGPARVLDAAAHPSPLDALPVPAAFARSEAIDLMVRGGYPEIRRLDGRDRADRHASYLDSIVERDVAQLYDVRKPDALRRLMNQLAARTACELNVAELCSALGAKAVTVQAWMDILRELGVVRTLGAWAAGLSGREIKRPKLHLMDTGVAAAVRGEDAASYDIPSGDPTALGPILETFVFGELEKSLPFQDLRWGLHHYRDQRGREIDIVAEAPGRRLALFETKAATTVAASDFAHADWFLGPGGPGAAYAGTAFVVYLGPDLLSFGPGRIALPLSVFWSFS